jgi:nucleoid-associated protein YgaU
MGGVSRTIEDVVRGFGDAARSTTLQAKANEPAPSIEGLAPAPAPATRPPAEPVTASRADTEPSQADVKPAPKKQPARKIYVVQDGDVLATVAKKAYGAEEGNKLANIKRIFEANRTVLKSPDEIFVGQKLLIPPLPQARGAGKPDTPLSEALFEKVQNIGKRKLADMKVQQPEGRYYVVQDGDNLWKIATSHLGNGARFEEIAKLNTDILKSQDAKLDIGMRLRLPAK